MKTCLSSCRLIVLGIIASVLVITCASCGRLNDFGTPLLNAVSRGDYDKTLRLIREGQDVNQSGPYGKTPLILASFGSSEEIVELLLKEGADVKVKTNIGTTALHAACSKARLKNVELLLQYGASVDMIDDSAQTPLFKAVSVCPAEVVELLLAKGASVHVRDAYGWQPLHHALRLSRLPDDSLEKYAIVVALLKHGADPSSGNSAWEKKSTQGDSQPTPLAIFQRHKSRTSNADTPIAIAKENGLSDIVELLALSTNTPSPSKSQP